jgi:lysophospholipase L1-like esterase
MPSARATTLPRRLSTVLLIAQLLIALLALRNWAYVTTYRLYLEQRVDDARESTAAQQFDVEGSHVVPRIVTRGRDHVAFKAAIGQDSTIYAIVRPAGRARYEISLRDGTDRRVLARGDVQTPTAVACPFPTGNGVVELTSDDALEWVDPRIVRGLHVGRHCIALTILFLVSFATRRRRHSEKRSADDAVVPRIAWFRACTALFSASFVVLLIEGGLRLSGEHLAGGIAAERHDLGEVGRDSRWEESPRYGRRLRANVDTVNEWRYGDIVRMGYIPPDVSDGTLHRFEFRTDREGFRNASTRERFDVAALGDSFTDAMTMAVDASWPVQLERRLGVAVQNYGTAGFGPQQELLVLKDYVAAHRPRLVVLAFFAGNDIFDTEAFDQFERSGGSVQRPAPGWRIKDVVSRADTWFVVSALRASAAWLGKHETTNIAVAGVDAATAPSAATASFDRGMFNVPVGGRILRWAFMPPYLNTLNFSEDVLSRRPGWSLTRGIITAMQQETHRFDAELVVMFLPFKSQVYLPLLQRTFSRDDLQSAFQFYLRDGPPIELADLARNRLAQNRLMQQLCAELAIPFLDTTGILQAEFEAGRNMYFPDESHLNEAGQAVVAEALAAFLYQTGLVSHQQ